MIKGIAFFMLMWLFVSLGLIALNITEKSVRKLIFKSVLYGMLTAAFAAGIIFGIVTLF